MLATYPAKMAAVAAGLVLAGAAAAAAVGPPPEAADHGLTTATERAGFAVPATPEGRPDADDHPGGPADDAEDGAEDQVPTDEVPTDHEGTDADDEGDEGDGARANHGAAVSAVAQDDSTTGRAHGQAVAEVARSDAGKPPHAGGGGDEDDDDDDPTDDRAGHAGQGGGKGAGRGRP